MADLKMTMPLSEILLLPGGKGINQNFIDIMKEDDIPVFCINEKTNKKRFLSYNFLNNNKERFWLENGDVGFYLVENCFNMLKEKAIKKTGSCPIEWGASQKTEKETNPAPGFGDEYKVISKLSSEEKVSLLSKSFNMLYGHANQKTSGKSAVVKAFVDSTKDAAVVNHVALEEVMELADEEAKKHTQRMVNITGEMVKSSVKLITRDIFSNELMNVLVKQSNGTIIQHITRVYLNGIAYIAHYNNLFSSSAIQKIRASFKSNYSMFYHKLLPHININEINLERVFYGGMKPIPPEMFSNWAIGFLLHDIGKADAIEYHEGEKRYDRDIVSAHVNTGYKSIMTKTNYPVEAGLIAGFHHEYYGDPDGYGYYRTGLEQYKKQKPDLSQNYCIAYEYKPVMDYKVLGYFPAKVLEIIDVFDSLTDLNRVYRKSMTPNEALDFMRQNFIFKKQKVDMILFDIFRDFLKKKMRT